MSCVLYAILKTPKGNVLFDLDIPIEDSNLLSIYLSSKTKEEFLLETIKEIQSSFLLDEVKQAIIKKLEALASHPDIDFTVI